eukprot:SAG22_NODE_157_length_16986_cov_17.230177_8_plen_410_part_00
MKLIPDFMLESASGMYPATGQDFAKVEFSLLGSEMAGVSIPPGLVITGGTKFELFGTVLSGDGMIMAGMNGLLPSLVFALQLPKIQIGKALQICKTADCTGDFGPFFYSQLGKPPASVDPTAFGANRCTTGDLFCLEMVGYSAMPALGMSSECTIEYTPLAWLLKSETKLGLLNPHTFSTEISFSLTFSDGMDYSFKAELEQHEVEREKGVLKTFFGKYSLVDVDFTGMEIAGTVSAGGGDGVAISAKAKVYFDFRWMRQDTKKLDVGFDWDVSADMDGAVVDAVMNYLQEQFPWAFKSGCEGTDGMTAHSAIGRGCECGGEGGETCNLINGLYCSVETVSAWDYKGCFMDNNNGQRDLNGEGGGAWAHQIQGTNDGTSAMDQCSDKCKNFKYMGLQWDNECFCDKLRP